MFCQTFDMSHSLESRKVQKSSHVEIHESCGVKGQRDIFKYILQP